MSSIIVVLPKLEEAKKYREYLIITAMRRCLPIPLPPWRYRQWETWMQEWF